MTTAASAAAMRARIRWCASHAGADARATRATRAPGAGARRGAREAHVRRAIADDARGREVAVGDACERTGSELAETLAEAHVSATRDELRNAQNDVLMLRHALRETEEELDAYRKTYEFVRERGGVEKVREALRGAGATSTGTPRREEGEAVVVDADAARDDELRGALDNVLKLRHAMREQEAELEVCRRAYAFVNERGGLEKVQRELRDAAEAASIGVDNVTEDANVYDARVKELESDIAALKQSHANAMNVEKARMIDLERAMSDRDNETAQAVSDALSQALEESEAKNRELEEELNRALWEEELRLKSLEAEMRDRLESSSGGESTSVTTLVTQAEEARVRAEKKAELLELEFQAFEQSTVDALCDAAEKLQRSEEGLKSLEQDLLEARSMVSTLEFQKSEIEQAMNDAESRFAEDFSNAQHHRDELEARIRELEETIERAAGAEEIAELTMNISNLESQKHEIEQAMRENESRFVDELFEARNQRDGFDARVRELEENLQRNDRSAEVAQMSKTIADLEWRKGELEQALRDTESRLGEELANAVTRRDELDARVRELEANIAQDASSDEIARLSAELASAQERAESIRAEKESNERRIGELEKAMNELESYLKKEQQGRAEDGAAREEELDKLRQDTRALEDQLASAQAKLEEASNATTNASSFDDERAELLVKIEALEAIIIEGGMDAKFAPPSEDIAQLKLEFERKEAAFLKEKAKLSRAAQLGIEIIKLKDVIAAECDELRSDLASSEREKRALMDEVAELRSQINDA